MTTEQTERKHQCDATTCYFGCCPECNQLEAQKGFHVVTFGKDQWGYCDLHRTVWWGGYGLISDTGESPAEKEALQKTLETYRMLGRPIKQ